MSLSRGRDLMAIPGPSVVPDAVLRAMHRPAPNIYEGDLIAVTDRVFAGLKRVAGTDGSVAIYLGNGHAAWEASLANLLLPGDKALVLATGRFGLGWAAMGRQMGIDIEVMDFGFQDTIDLDALETRLRADTAGSIKAVLAVHVDTASSVCSDMSAVRAAMDAAGHPALLVVDAIASLGCDRLEMDASGIDVLVAACQKGLMTPPGVAFTFQNDKAMARRVACPSPYWDWGPRVAPDIFYQYFCGTPPTHHLYGLEAALGLIFEEGLEGVWRRHAIFARAVWAAVEAWGTDGTFTLNIADPASRSHAVTTILTAPGDAARLRRWCADTSGLTLGVGLPISGSRATRSSVSGTWGISTRRCCSGRSRPPKPASRHSGSFTARAASARRRG